MGNIEYQSNDSRGLLNMKQLIVARESFNFSVQDFTLIDKKNNQFTLNFTYTAPENGFIYILQNQVIDKKKQETMVSINKPDVQYKFLCKPGKKNRFEQDTIKLDFSHLQRYKNLRDSLEYWPLVIIIGAQKKLLFYYFQVDYIFYDASLNLKRQNFQDGADFYRIMPMYGADHQNTGECCVCITNKIDTVVLPCKHFLLCQQCTISITESQQLSKCPICREKILHFISI